MEIPLTGLPDQSKLYTDYLENFDKVRKYYSVDFSSDDELRNHFSNTLQSFNPKRTKIVVKMR